MQFARLLIGIFDASQDVCNGGKQSRVVSPDRVLANRCSTARSESSTLRHGRGRSGGAIGSGGLARVNRHKERFVSRELNGLWSQSAAIAIDPHLRTRSAVPSRLVPCRYDPIRFPLRPTSALLDGSIHPVGGKSPRANCPTEYANFTAKIGRFPANLQAALFGFSHSLLKQEVYSYVPRVLKRIVNSGSKLQASDVISDHLIR